MARVCCSEAPTRDCKFYDSCFGFGQLRPGLSLPNQFCGSIIFRVREK
jgi:hypothetical protein